ncbi:MAG TPA: HAD-IA family hydrolase, partial [Nocardioides sp.]
LFEVVVISEEVAMRKPEAPIFDRTLSKLGLPAEECLFIDDAEPNVLGARAVGLDALLHTDPASTRAALAGMIPTLGGAA